MEEHKHKTLFAVTVFTAFVLMFGLIPCRVLYYLDTADNLAGEITDSVCSWILSNNFLGFICSAVFMASWLMYELLVDGGMCLVFGALLFSLDAVLTVKAFRERTGRRRCITALLLTLAAVLPVIGAPSLSFN